MGSATGRYLAATISGSVYGIDLDGTALSGRPDADGADPNTMRGDGGTVTLLRLEGCTVGRRMPAVLDLRLERGLVTTRTTTPVVFIARERPGATCPPPQHRS